MDRHKISRREFLYAGAAAAAGTALAACQPQTIIVETEKEVTKVVEKEVEKVVKETVVVEKEVEKEVTKVVEKEKVVTPTALPSQFTEAPMLAALGLPPVDERLPQTPLVVEPYESVGKYGGTWYMVTKVSPTSHVSELLQYEGLLRYSPGGLDILPNVAESWDETKDGKEFIFHLRKGIKWSDGELMTADDVVFWFEDVQANKELYSSLPSWLRVGGEGPTVAKLDDYTVRFTYTVSAPFLARQIGYPNHEVCDPKHYLIQYHPKYTSQTEIDNGVKEKGVDTWSQLFLMQRNRDVNTALPQHYAWTLDSTTPDGNVYARNPYYWKVDPEGNQLPYIDTVETRVAANVEVAQMMAFSGEAELQTFSVGQFPADTMILKKNEETGKYHVIDAPISEPNVCVFGLNLSCKNERLRGIYSDKRFRIALSHAIKREDIRQLVYLGQPKEIRQCAPLRESPFYHEAAAQNYVEYDPDKANALLDELGYTNRDSDGNRLAADGEPIPITIEIIGKRNDFIDALEMVAGWWTEVGIKATAKAVETSLYFTRVNGNEIEAGVDYSGNGMFPVLGPSDYIPISGGSVWAPDWGAWYTSGGESGTEPPPEVKDQLELYDKITAEPDEAKRKDMDINAENCYAYGICDRASVPIVVSNKFHNVPDTGWNIAWEAGNIGTTNPCQYWKEE
jgi:peptide/nickel transport system substrate-binding protein